MIQLSTKNSIMKTISRWLLGFLLLVVVLFLVFIIAAKVLPPIAIGQIAELTNTKIETDSVDLDIDGSVIISKLVVSPYKKQSYDDTILRAESVHARFGIGSLLLLRPRLKAIDVNDFVFNAQYDVDASRWNVSALKIKFPKGGSGRMPRIRLEDGTLQYSKISNGRTDVVTSVPVKANFGFDEETQEGYKFDITTATLASGFGKSRLTGSWKPGLLTLTGGISSTDIPVLEMVWAIDVLAAELKYEPDNAYLLKLRVRDFRSKTSPPLDKFALVGPSFLELSSQFAALKKFFDRYRPAGRVDVVLDAQGNLKQLTESNLTGIVDCCDVTICDSKFPYTVEHLTGQIDFTKTSATLNNLRGIHGDVVLFFNGWSRGLGPDWQYDIRMTSDNMILDDDLYDALSEKQKKFWSLFSPAGSVAIDLRRLRRSSTDREKTLVVELDGTDAVYRHFPYPLKNLTGRLLFNSGEIIFSDIVSQVNDRKITINGKAITAGVDATLRSSSLRSTRRPLYDITIDANNVPLDSTLEASLPDKQRSLYEQFDLSGLADGRVKLSSPQQGTGPVAFEADLSFREASLKSKQLPLAVSDISADAVFTPDLIRVDSFTGRHSDGLLFVIGRIWPGPDSKNLRYSLGLNGRQSQLGDELFDLLPKPLKKNLLEFQPQGRINYTADLDKADSNGYPDYSITVDCLANSINYRLIPYPLKDVTGRLEITKETIELSDITAVPADSLQITAELPVIKLNGRVALADNSFSSGRFRIDAGNILFDEQFDIALPESLKALYKKLSPTGRFDVNSANIEISKANGGQKDIDFDGIVKFKDCDFDLPGDVTELYGELEAHGLYKTGEGFKNSRAFLSADHLRIGGRAFKKLNTDLYYDDNRKDWFTEKLFADCYGGKLIGELHFKQPPDGPLGYRLHIGFNDIDLKQFLTDASRKSQNASGQTQFKGHTTGKMDGSLGISARVGDSSSRLGRCRLAVSDMQVGQLSPLAKLVLVLGLTEPKDFAFNRMLVDSYIKGDKVFFKQFDLSGDALAFSGTGSTDLKDRSVDLILAGRGDRIKSADPSFLQSLAEGLGRAVVRIEVSGSIYDPKVETKAFPVIEDSLNILGTKPPEPKP